ncbi:MAG: biopolymer transporter Tol [Bacteroidetes bacterium]|nr:biopolymer transporter Tol [Bacteroidota bacterium]
MKIAIRVIIQMTYNITVLLFIFCVTNVFAQESYNHPELDWFTIETKHFFVHYHKGTERTAREVAKIAETIYPTITSLYNHTPDQKVTFIIRDHDDYSNGASYFYDNKIEIWAPALDFHFRGVHPWLWNVVTHEFTHLIQIQTLMKFGRKVPSVYFQWLSYEKEYRPDVLYGYPNVLVSYPLSGFVLPSWFAEGVAQYNAPEYTFDYWDTHRDMLLRTAILHGTLLSWDEMSVFGKNSLGNESAYNAGFSLVKYIAESYGVDKLASLSRELGKLHRLTIDEALQNVLGKSGKELYAEWKAEKEQYYKKLIDSLQTQDVNGEVIEADGFGNFYPVFSRSGKFIAYVSNKGRDYLTASSLYLYNQEMQEVKLLVQNVHSTLSFSPDDRYIYYSKVSSQNKHRSNFSDLYRYDIVEQKEERLTYGLRAANPKISPDGKTIVFVFGNDGTLNLGLCQNNGKGIRSITNFRDGEQVFTPSWSHDGEKIVFGFSSGHCQHIASIDTSGNYFTILIKNGDSRHPTFSCNGESIIFSWDKTGIFNLYELSLTDSTIRQITNVTGGAFAPSANKQGDIVYALYTKSGYSIALLKNKECYTSECFQISSLQRDSTCRDSTYKCSNELPPTVTEEISESKSYRSRFTSVSLIPFLRLDQYNKREGLDIIKPGFYVTSNEVLDNMSLFGGIAINRKYERDIFVIFEYRNRLPLLYQFGLAPTATLELYSVSRTLEYEFNLYINRLEKFQTNVEFNLFEFDASLSHPFVSLNNSIEVRYIYSRYNQNFGSWLHPTYGVIPASRMTYLKSNTLVLSFKHDGILPASDMAINPKGRTITLKYSYEMNRYNPNDSAEYKNGLRVPVYIPYNLHRLELSWREHLPLPLKNHVLALSIRSGSILGNTVDNFFDFYAGGFIGMRGYPFYAVSGNEMLVTQIAYRFPLSTELNTRLLHLYFKRLYGIIFYDFGNAWSGKTPAIKQWKSDVGFELRLETFSWYVYPTRVFFSGAYGLRSFTRTIETLSHTTIQYGGEWRFYLGVLFDFEISDVSRYIRH